MSRPSNERNKRPEVFLGLLGGFQLFRNGQVVTVPLGAQRTLAFLAFHDLPLRRTYVAGTLWPDVKECAANASLRSSIWRLGSLDCELLRATPGQIAIAPEVTVDVREMRNRARRLIDESGRHQTEDLEGLSFSGDVLPGWYEEWILFERERLRQLCMHALEALCRKYAQAGRFGHAVEAGLAVIRMEPLRETAHKILIETFIREGNRAEAVRQYLWYRKLVWNELGLRPSAEIHDLVRTWL